MTDELEVGEIDAVEQQNQSKEVDEDASLPEKFKGKTKAQLYEYYKNTENALSRQGQELGEVRKLADELLKQQLTKKAEEKPVEVDIFENPQEAIRQAIESNPSVKQAREYAEETRKEMARSKLYQKHPDTDAILAEEDFKSFVGKSKVRMELLQRADKQFDIDAADELLSTYKEVKAVKAAKAQEAGEAELNADKEARNKQLNAAFVDTGSTGESSKKVYRRRDLINLRLRDPRKFDAMADEINRAYAEGRVR